MQAILENNASEEKRIISTYKVPERRVLILKIKAYIKQGQFLDLEKLCSERNKNGYLIPYDVKFFNIIKGDCQFVDRSKLPVIGGTLLPFDQRCGREAAIPVDQRILRSGRQSGFRKPKCRVFRSIQGSSHGPEVKNRHWGLFAALMIVVKIKSYI